MKRKKLGTTEKGNVLFLILIAVALFAALSYAVTQSSRSGGGDISDEQAKLLTAQLLSYANNMKTAVTRMKITNGCTDADISFETDMSAYDYSHSPTATEKCRVFHPNGGKIQYWENPDWLRSDLDFNSVKTYLWWIVGDQDIEGLGSPASELLLNFVGIDYKICREINRLAGITYSGDTPPTASGSNYAVPFKGVYTLATDSEDGTFANQSFFCSQTGGSTNPVFTFVLLER